MSIKTLPLAFVQKSVCLSWRDAAWGYEHGYLGWSSLVDLAVTNLVRSETNDPLEIELAALQKDEAWKAGDIARELARKELEVPDDGIVRKWLFLVLAWTFEKKSQIGDSLEKVEEIYADFGYPSEIETFVRYMPVIDGYDPTQHSESQNIQRLMNLWKDYLSAARLKFSPQAE